MTLVTDISGRNYYYTAAMDMYTISICGLQRSLPLAHVGKHTRLANFTFLGDIELVDRLADTFAEKLRLLAFDYVVGTDVKTVPLAHGIAKRLGHHRFVVCRKSVKPYMVNPIVLKPLEYYPKHIRPLVINGTDAALLRGKKVVVIDDVVSTGMTMRMMGGLMTRVGAHIMHYATVLKQGKQFDHLPNLIYLAELPIFS